MKILNLKVDDAVHKRVKILVARSGSNIREFVRLAINEKLTREIQKLREQQEGGTNEQPHG